MNDEQVSTHTITHPHFAFTVSSQPVSADGAPAQLNFSLETKHPKIAAFIGTVGPIVVQNLPLILKIFGL